MNGADSGIIAPNRDVISIGSLVKLIAGIYESLMTKSQSNTLTSAERLIQPSSANDFNRLFIQVSVS